MKIAYYMPFKAMGHPHPSGDLVQGTELFAHLEALGHECRLISSLRCRWLYLQPARWPQLILEYFATLRRCREFAPDLWLSYHSYYKAPDLLGPYCTRSLGIPYAIFQGIYSTKPRKKFKTLPGFYLNRKTLTSAQLVFTNKHRDEQNLRRLLPENRIQYVAPGIHPADFSFDPKARAELRAAWEVGNTTVIMAAAMFRPGVKTLGLKIVIEACAELIARGRKLQLIIAGAGKSRSDLETLAARVMPGRTLFLGKIARQKLAAYYSSADIFAFPGIEESLGMVYLEAQSCALPVVACEEWGGREAVVDGQTGLLSPSSRPQGFVDNLDTLVGDSELRAKLGCQAAKHVRQHHDIDKTYGLIAGQLVALIR